MSTSSTLYAQSTSVKSTDSHRSYDNSMTNFFTPELKCTPCGIVLCSKFFQFKSKQAKLNYHRCLVLILTFIAYASFHMCRRPFTIVKNEFSPKDSDDHHAHHVTTNVNQNDSTTNNELIETQTPSDLHISTDNNIETHLPEVFEAVAGQQTIENENNSTISWAPFNNKDTVKGLFSLLDTAFLLSYAISMFFSGYVAERTNLRHFIALAGFMSGLGLIAFGLARVFDIHSLSYFVFLQIFCGVFQSIAWPVAVTCVGNWVDKRLGLVYAIWNSHTNLGNIIGAWIAGYFVMQDWSLSFIAPGVVMIGVSCALFLFLVPAPRDVDLDVDFDSNSSSNLNNNNNSQPDKQTQVSSNASSLSSKPTIIGDIAKTNKSGKKQQQPKQLFVKSINDNLSQGSADKAVSFFEALAIPGVIEYSMCLFFSKLVSYTFLCWLPVYIKQSSSFDSKYSAYLSIALEVGGLPGAIITGYLSDVLQVNGVICNVMLLAAIPSMFAFEKFGSISVLHNVALQILVGFFVNGPYCLITTSVSAELSSRVQNSRAMATVTAIIDGVGSLGAVVGPLVVGFISTDDWNFVFLMLMSSTLLASLCIARVTVKDLRSRCSCTNSGSLVINE